MEAKIFYTETTCMIVCHNLCTHTWALAVGEEARVGAGPPPRRTPSKKNVF